MLRCREISRLFSESMDRELPLRQKLQVWMHMAMCRLCSGFARQLRLLRQAARENPERLLPGASDSEATLPEDARERIKAALRDTNL
jgi:hypothetical protein